MIKFAQFLVQKSFVALAALFIAADALAQDAPVAAQPPGFASMLVPMAGMFLVMYLLVIRPKQKEMKKHQQMMSGLKQGDEILTASGILGKVAGMTDRVVTVEVATNVRVRMLKSQITQIINGNLTEVIAAEEKRPRPPGATTSL